MSDLIHCRDYSPPLKVLAGCFRPSRPLRCKVWDWVDGGLSLHGKEAMPVFFMLTDMLELLLAML